MLFQIGLSDIDELSHDFFTPSVNDPELEIILFRPQEMSRYIQDGIVDCGLTGHDWIVENSSKVTELCQLQYSKQTSNPVRWVLAVHESSKVQSVKDLQPYFFLSANSALQK